LAARQAVGPIAVGCAAVTPGFGLDAKYVIHTVGPVWRGGLLGEEKLLRRCYDSALKLAMEQGCGSVAFPLISTGNYGFPKDKALQIALAAFSEFLLEQEMMIYLVVYDRDSFHLSGKLQKGVAAYIDENYVQTQRLASNGAASRSKAQARRRMDMEVCESCAMPEEMVYAAAMPAPKAMSLEEMLKQTDAGFTETLLGLIDQSGKKDSEIYKRANISKQHFSKIRNNPDYKPTKPTAIALAVALELDVEQTKDLIGRAGFTLTNSSKFDVIIRYFIERKQFNIMDINMTLFEFDQNLLGA
jgi:hypothetical protein